MQIKKTLEILNRTFPTATTTLNKMRNKFSPFEMLIACLLSLRAKDETTSPISEELFKVANTPEKIIKLPIKKLEKIIFSTGHYHKKAEIVKSVSREIKKLGYVPNTFEELIKIKHIGPKTANIVLAFSFNKEVIPIDVHCHRIPNRLGWIKTNKPEETQVELMKIVPKKYWSNFNSVFVQFGREICLPLKPHCSTCPVKKYCRRINVKNSD